MASYAGPSSVEWVESGGGPLIAIPEVVLPFWTGADGDELASDYDRACEVEGFVGLLPVGNTTALVLGDDPAATAYLPEHGTFVRWCAGESERELLAGVPAALAGAAWEREVRWEIPGPWCCSTRRGRVRSRRRRAICGSSSRRGGTRCGRRMRSRGPRRGSGSCN